MDSPYVTTTEAAAELGVTPARVRQLIGEGHLDATPFSGVWMIARDSLDRARKRPGPGWPKGKSRKSKPA